jgi:hypothetical protein
MKKGIIIAVVLVVLLSVTGFAVFSVINKKSGNTAVSQNAEPTPDTIPTIDSSIKVNAKLVSNNTISLDVTGLDGKMKSMAYELTYDSQGLIKGVNSGSKPLDLTGKNEITREVYMGTCSRNVCKPDLGVKKVSVALEFISTDDKKSQFSQDFDL